MAGKEMAQEMTTLTDRISQREEWVVASLLDNLDKQFPPYICTILALTDYWQNPIAQMMAKAIHDVLPNHLTKAKIALKLGPDGSRWLHHPTFYENGLPLDVAEYEAHDLCVYYRGKRLERLLGDAWQRVKTNPDAAKVVAQSLRAQLEEYTQ